jgi:CheY-like chemotaxis protein
LSGGAAVAKQIVAINDSSEILQLYREILEVEGGYSVTLMSYKPMLVEEVKTLRPDLIITDYKFREEEVGYNFVQQLKMDHETASIPVIVVSAALKEVREVEGYLESKDVGVLFKPFDVDELLNVVSQRLSGGLNRSDGESGDSKPAGKEEKTKKRRKRETKSNGN